MTRLPFVHGRALKLTGRRRGLWLVAAMAVLTIGLSGAAQVGGSSSGSGGPTVTVTVTDTNSPPNPRASTWGRVTSSPVGIDCPGDCTERFPQGSRVVLTARPKAGYVFAWDRDRGGNAGCREARTCLLTIDGDEHVRALLEPGARLFATTEGAGRLQLTPGGGRYRNGTRVTIRATVDKTVPGARFVGWSDYRCPPRRLSCTLRLRGHHWFTAIFEPVYLTVVEGAFGDIAFTPPSTRCTFAPVANEPARACRVPYPRNTLVTLNRTSGRDDGSVWDGACTGFASTCAVRMHTNRQVLAGKRKLVEYESFSAAGGVGEVIRLEYAGPRGGTISIRPVTGSGVTKPCRRTCTAGFGHGELVEIRARSGPGARFRRWADSRVRSSVRRVRIGLRNPVRAIFARR